MLKRHYDKVLSCCCFLFIFANIGLASTAFSVHQPYLVALEGIGDTGGSLILSARTLVSLAAMLIVDRYYRALDVRVGVTAACLLTAAGFAVYSQAAAQAVTQAAPLPAFFGGATLLGCGYGLGGMVAMTYLANRWFESGIGGVVGFASMGSGLASIVMPLLVVRVIEAASLSAAFALEGAVAAAIGALVFALLRNRPSDLGLQPYVKAQRPRTRHRGRADRAPNAGEGPRDAHPGSDVERGPSASESAKGRAESRAVPTGARGGMAAEGGEFALLFAAMTGVGVFSCCGITYLSVLATSSGFSAVFAATLVSVAGVTLTAAKYVAGRLFDRLGAPRASAIMFAFALVGFALACLAGGGSAPVMVVAAALIGAGLSLGTVGISVWSIHAGQIKNFQVAYALGGFVANTLPGIVKDLVGTYTVSYAACCVIIVAAALVILRHYRRGKSGSGGSLDGKPGL